MTATQTQAQINQRRAKLFMQLLLEDLRPDFINEEVPFSRKVSEYMIGFKNGDGGVNAVAIGATFTEREPPAEFALPQSVQRLWTQSRIPVLFVLIDVKHNKFYYAFSNARAAGAAAGDSQKKVAVQLKQLEKAKTEELRDLLAK